MRPTAARAIAALMLLLATGCATSDAGQSAVDDATAGTAAATHLGLVASTLDSPAHHRPGGASLRPPADTNPHRATSVGDAAEPEVAAASEVADRLDAEGLSVLDLDAEVAPLEPGLAIVTVTVLHGTGGGHPHASRYRVTLTDDGGWQAVTVEEVS
jgi:hypothetical protein